MYAYHTVHKNICHYIDSIVFRVIHISHKCGEKVAESEARGGIV